MRVKPLGATRGNNYKKKNKNTLNSNTEISYKMPTKATVRVSEADKRSDPAKYIENPSTQKMVLRDSPTGKKIIEA